MKSKEITFENLKVFFDNTCTLCSFWTDRPDCKACRVRRVILSKMKAIPNLTKDQQEYLRKEREEDE